MMDTRLRQREMHREQQSVLVTARSGCVEIKPEPARPAELRPAGSAPRAVGTYIRSGASIVSSRSPLRSTCAVHSASCTRARKSGASAFKTSCWWYIRA